MYIVHFSFLVDWQLFWWLWIWVWWLWWRTAWSWDSTWWRCCHGPSRHARWTLQRRFCKGNGLCSLCCGNRVISAVTVLSICIAMYYDTLIVGVSDHNIVLFMVYFVVIVMMICLSFCEIYLFANRVEKVPSSSRERERERMCNRVCYVHLYIMLRQPW